MKKEFITIQEKETTVRVQNTRVNAVRTKDILKKGVRVYENGKIGIAGAVGDINDSELVENAKQNLDTNIEYPYELSSNLKDYRDYSDQPISGERILSLTEDILDTLRRVYPEFDFSEGVSTKEICYKMTNTEGLDLEYRDTFLSLGLLLKENKSANLFDGMLAYLGRSFDLNKFWSFNKEVLNAYNNPVDMPEGEVLPIFSMGFSELQAFLAQCLNGERYATGSSIFSDKLNKKLFSDRITIKQNRKPIYNVAPFFDMEGIVQKDDSYTLIDKGKLTGVYTDRRSASLYDLPNTGAASGSYDDIPSLGGAPIHFDIDSMDVKAAIGGSLAIFVVMSSGGDFTADGSFAAPVQVAFLFDGEKIVGRVPEFTMRSHLNKMLQDDYIGTFENEHFYLGDGQYLQGFYMNIVK